MDLPEQGRQLQCACCRGSSASISLNGRTTRTTSLTVSVVTSFLSQRITDVSGRIVGSDPAIDDGDRLEYEGLAEKFSKFFTRATSCPSLSFSAPSHNLSNSSQPSASPSPSEPIQSKSLSGSSSTVSNQRRQIVLLEDLPNVLHQGTQEAFHSSLRRIIDSPIPPSSPVVIIISDSGMRGEDSEALDGPGPSGWKGKGRDSLSVGTVLPTSVLFSQYVTQIA